MKAKSLTKTLLWLAMTTLAVPIGAQLSPGAGVPPTRMAVCKTNIPCQDIGTFPNGDCNANNAGSCNFKNNLNIVTYCKSVNNTTSCTYPNPTLQNPCTGFCTLNTAIS